MLRNHRRGTVEASSPSTRLGPHARLHAGRINSAPGQSRQVRQRSDRGEKGWGQSSPRLRPNERPAGIASNHPNLSKRANLHVCTCTQATPEPTCCSCTSMRRENGGWNSTTQGQQITRPSWRAPRLFAWLHGSSFLIHLIHSAIS